jgi:hypothetical protein
MTENAFLKQFENKPITEATTNNMRIHTDALHWHLENVVRQWD